MPKTGKALAAREERKAKAKLAKKQRREAKRAKKAEERQAAIDAGLDPDAVAPKKSNKTEEEKSQEQRLLRANPKVRAASIRGRSLLKNICQLEEKRLKKWIKFEKQNLEKLAAEGDVSDIEAKREPHQLMLEEYEEDLATVQAMKIQDLVTCLLYRIKHRSPVLMEKLTQIPILSPEMQEFNKSPCVKRILSQQRVLNLIKGQALDLTDTVTGFKSLGIKKRARREAARAKRAAAEVEDAENLSSTKPSKKKKKTKK
ncbi:hypothetical protein IWW52_005782 [Coemansia sp. RSA 2704]|nr:hypothetical protein IWW52_005782 [Coemansia sp. RSA 2704]